MLALFAGSQPEDEPSGPAAIFAAMELSLRPAGSADISLIHQLAEKIWHVHYTPIIGKQQVAYMLDKLYSHTALARQMEAGQQFFLAELGGKPFGYLAVTEQEGDEFFLNKFYIGITEQGKGYGKKLFQLLLERFPSLKTLRLQVNRKNFKSINFYFRLGFVIEESKDFDIGAGFFMEDFVMVYKRS